MVLTFPTFLAPVSSLLSVGIWFLFSHRVTQVYAAIDDRLTSLKTDTFSKTREEKMEDLFAQKDVGLRY